MTIRKLDARKMYICICLQLNEDLFTHLPVSVILRQSMLPTHSGSTSEHCGIIISVRIIGQSYLLVLVLVLVYVLVFVLVLLLLLIILVLLKILVLVLVLILSLVIVLVSV
jgi:hypothetical protein